MRQQTRKLIIVGYYSALMIMGIGFFIGFINLFLSITLAIVGAIIIYIPDVRKRKKAFAYLGILLSVSSVVIQWPIGYILPMTGYIKDKVTGEAIENVIFEVEWSHRYASVGGASGVSSGVTYAVSDKEGKYLIRGRLVLPFPPGSYGFGQIIRLRHPLYEGKELGGSACAENIIMLSSEDGWSSRISSGRPHLRPRVGRINRDFKLMKLEDKYRDAPQINGVSFFDEIWHMKEYYAQASKLAVNMDWISIQKHWESLVVKHNYDFDYAQKEFAKILSFNTR